MSDLSRVIDFISRVSPVIFLLTIVSLLALRIWLPRSRQRARYMSQRAHYLEELNYANYADQAQIKVEAIPATPALVRKFISYVGNVDL